MNQIYKLPAKDSLFIVTEKRYGICGTGMEMPPVLVQKYDEIVYNLKKPFYLNPSVFDTIYRIDNKLIVAGATDTGPEGCNCFTSGKYRFYMEDTLIRKLYILNFKRIRKSDVTVLVQDFAEKKTFKTIHLQLEKRQMACWKK